MNVERMIGYPALVADLDEPGCPICRASVRAAAKYLESFLWENVNDFGVRDVLRKDHGFCREHTLALLQVAAARSEALGVAILYEDLLERIELELESAKPLRRARACRACEVSDDVAVNYLKVIAASEAGAELDGRLKGSLLCLAHLLRGLNVPRVDRHRLVEVWSREASIVRSELRTLIEHADYRRIREPAGEERDAWVRAVHLVIGSPVHGGGSRSI
jgi:hypothetical protein